MIFYRPFRPRFYPVILSFFLFSCSFNQLREKVAERYPADADLISHRDLRRMYPEISDEAFSRKLERANQPLKFFRAFPPAFFRYFAKMKNEWSQEIQNASRFTGWCAGDPHPENFGSSMNQKGDIVFNLIDLDDSGPCSILADLFRFLIAAQESLDGRINREHSLERLMDAYLDGASGRVKLSAPTLSFLNKSESERFFDPNLKVFEGDRELTSSVSESEEQAIEAALTQSYGKILKLQATKYSKSGGGSAGLLRYRVQFKIHELWITVEMKSLTTPAVFFEREDASPPASDQNLASPTVRARKALKQVFQDDHSEFFTAEMVAKRPMVFTPRYKSIRSIEIDRDSSSTKTSLQILRDEAATLGSLHSRSTEAFETYLSTLKQIKTEELENVTQALWTSMTKSWKASKNLN